MEDWDDPNPQHFLSTWTSPGLMIVPLFFLPQLCLPRVAKVVQVGGTVGFQVSQESRSVAGAESSAADACCGLGHFLPFRASETLAPVYLFSGLQQQQWQQQ